MKRSVWFQPWDVPTEKDWDAIMKAQIGRIYLQAPSGVIPVVYTEAKKRGFEVWLWVDSNRIELDRLDELKRLWDNFDGVAFDYIRMPKWDIRNFNKDTIGKLIEVLKSKVPIERRCWVIKAETIPFFGLESWSLRLWMRGYGLDLSWFNGEAVMPMLYSNVYKSLSTPAHVFLRLANVLRETHAAVVNPILSIYYDQSECYRKNTPDMTQKEVIAASNPGLSSEVSFFRWSANNEWTNNIPGYNPVRWIDA